MTIVSVPAFTRKLRDVVADEPKAFAYDLGLSLSAVYNYLNGRIPATEVLFRIARYTGRPMEWFLVDEEMLLSLTEQMNAVLVDPLKTTIVQDYRCMTTWVLRRVA